MDIAIRKTTDTESSFRLAVALPDYFNAAGLEHMKADLASGELYGAFTENELIGFAVYQGTQSSGRGAGVARSTPGALVRRCGDSTGDSQSRPPSITLRSVPGENPRGNSSEPRL